MKASEARELSRKARIRNLDEVYSKIRFEASQGRTVTAVFTELTPDEVERLTEEGYDVLREVVDHGDFKSNYIQVSW